MSALILAGVLLCVAVLPALRREPAVQRRIESEKDSAKLIRERAEYFYHQRAFPLGFIPAGARLKAYQEKQTILQNEGTLMQRLNKLGHSTFLPSVTRAAGPIVPNGTTWTDIGPEPTASADFGMTSGRINAVAVDPCDATGNTLYVGGALGGLWKTTDALSTNPAWTPLTDSEPSSSTGSLALDTNLGDCTGGHTGRIYYGTGEENFAYDSFYGAGVLVSTDGGSTWTKDNTFVTLTNSNGTVITPQSSTYAGPFIGSLAVDPATAGSSQVVLAGIQGISSTAHSGVYRSTDGGLTWTREFPTNSQPSAYDYATGVAFDPNDATGNTAYAALGIPYCSGTCGTGEEVDNGVYKSTNNGLSWTRLTGLDTAIGSALGTTAESNYGRITIAVGPSTPTGTELVAAIADITTQSSNLLGAFISKDGGNTFAPLNTSNFCNAQCFYDMAAAINPANPQEIILGGGPAAMGRDGSGNSVSPQCGQFGPDNGISAAIITTDGGSTFHDISCDNSSGTFIHVDTHAFAFGLNGEFFTGNDGGIWSSNNLLSNSLSPAPAGSQNWSDLNGSLELTQFYPGISINPSNPEIGFSGSQDNGTQEFDPAAQASNPRDWLDTDACGDGGWTAIDPHTPSTVFAACEAIGQVGTVNLNVLDGLAGQNGFNWIAIDTPAMDNDASFSTLFVPPLVLDTNNPQNVYFGTYRVWQSTTGGYSWNPISADLTGASNPSSNCYQAGSQCVVSTMAVAPTSSDTLYVGTDLGLVYLSTNATAGTNATFTEIDHTSGGSTPSRFVTQIAVSPTNPQVAFVSYSGFSSCTSPPASSKCDGLGHIYEVTGNGATWTNVTGNLPDTPVNDIVIDPTDITGNKLYVATDVGVFGTTNALAGSAAIWMPVATGLPDVECTSIKLDNTARILRVGTHGRGDWDLQLPFSSPTALELTGISPTSTTAGSSNSLTLTLSGQNFPGSPTVSFGTNSLTPSAASANQITVSVPSSDIAGSGVVQVSVSGSNALNFSIEGPAPALTSISPVSASTASAVTLTVNGSAFNANSEVLWVPNAGTNSGNPTVLTQNPGGTSTSFTVTVPASVLTSTTSQLIPFAPGNRQGPWSVWLLAVFIVAVCGSALFFALPKRRRLVLGTTIAFAALLFVIGGCSSAGNNINLPPPGGGGTGTATVLVLNPAPGGGISSGQNFTVTQ